MLTLSDLRRIDFAAAVFLFLWALVTLLWVASLAELLPAKSAFAAAGIAIARWIYEVNKAAKLEASLR